MFQVLKTQADLDSLRIGAVVKELDTGESYVYTGETAYTHGEIYNLKSRDRCSTCIGRGALLSGNYSAFIEIDLTKLDKQFKDLSNQEKKALACAAIDGEILQYWSIYKGCWLDRTNLNYGSLHFTRNDKYRVRPKESQEETLIKKSIEEQKESLDKLEKELLKIRGGE